MEVEKTQEPKEKEQPREKESPLMPEQAGQDSLEEKRKASFRRSAVLASLLIAIAIVVLEGVAYFSMMGSSREKCVGECIGEAMGDYFAVVVMVVVAVILSAGLTPLLFGKRVKNEDGKYDKKTGSRIALVGGLILFLALLPFFIIMLGILGGMR